MARKKTARPRSKSAVTVRQVPGGDAWELVHPRCVRDRAEDLEDVVEMLAAGEDEVATDELRWLLEGCPDFIEAHKLLGELGWAAGDVKLARAHFGYAYHIGVKALPPGGLPGPLSYDLPANQPFLDSAKALALCLKELGKLDMARDVVRRLLACDPRDPLQAEAWLREG